MKKSLIALATGSLVIAAGFSNGLAQDDEDDNNVVPVELYACNYNDGKGPADLDKAVAKWNAWADSRGVKDYTAWTLTPFYASPEQEFDVLWLGVTPSAKALGAAQDDWLANGAAIQAEFDKASPCNAHSNFAAVEFKAPPERENRSHIVISFSDCNIEDGRSFGDDVAPAISAWADYRTQNGSTSGIWVLFPVYGGGGEKFDFKYVTAYGNLAEQGADWDQYAAAGRHKARELFRGMIDCDSARVYSATNRRRAAEME